MKNALLAVVMLAQVTAALRGYAQSQSPEVDASEVRRLGDYVARAGDGQVHGEQDEVLAALQMPDSDIDKWFISVVGSKSCAACEKLKRAWETDPWLLAFANPADPKKSWAHFSYYVIEDQSQNWRFTKLTFKAYPTILVQPPRSGKFGDPALVVFMKVYSGSPEDLAKEITAAIRRYLSRRVEVNSERGLRAVTTGTWPTLPAVEADGDRLPPFSVPPVVDPAPTPNVVPVLPDEIPPKPKPHVFPIIRKDEIIVVRDGEYDAETEALIRQAVDSVRDERGQRLAVRSVEWQEVKDSLPVSEDELPALLLVERGLIGGKISAKLLPLVTPRGGLLLTIWLWLRDVFVWMVNFAILACVVLIGLAIWGLVRRRRSAQQQPLQFNGPVAYSADQVAEILASERRRTSVNVTSNPEAAAPV